MFSLKEKLNRRRLGGLWSYTLAFTGLMLVILSVFYYFNRSMIWQPDGEDIYFIIMRYTRDYLLGIVKTLVKTGRLAIPQWDFSIGQGNNVLVGFHFNPFFLFALLCPTKYLEYAYGLMAFAQLYCAGAAFCLFCRRVHQTEPFPVALGAIVYTFCGFAFHASYSHLYFTANLMLALVLLLLGAERFLQEGRWGLFTAAVVFALLGGYYYAYMDTLLMTVYLVIRQLCVNGKDLKRSFFQLLRLFLAYLLGFALSLFNFLPAVMNYFICARTGTGGGGVSLFYPVKQYLEMASSVASPQFTGTWNQLSFFAIALVAVTLVVLRRERETRIVRVCLAVCGVFFLFPIFGKIFNGFGYVSNRWCFGLALCVAMATVYGAKDLWNLTAKERRTVCIVAGVWMAVALVLNLRYEVIWGAALTVLTLLAVLLPDKSRYHDRTARRVAWATGFSAVVFILIFFLPALQNEMGDYREGNTINRALTRSAEFAAVNIRDDSFYRVEVPPTRTNRFAISGENGTSSYWSALPAKLSDYYLQFGLSSLRLNYACWGLDRSTIISTLSGVKYNIDNTGDTVPYGFEDAGIVKGKSREYQLTKNKYALPIGYTYDRAMSSEDFMALDPIQRQQAMLQCAVMDTVPEGLTAAQPEITAQVLPCSMENIRKMEETEQGMHFMKNGSFDITFEAVPDSEIWLYMDNLTCNHRSDVVVTCGNTSRKTFLYGPDGDHYFEREGVAFNLGCGLKGKVTVHVSLSRGAYYTFTPVVYALPMEDYVRDVTKLGEQTLENVSVTTNRVSGTITLSEPRLLVLTIPHIGGWTATVDGEEQLLLDVNTLYMGLMLDAGEHTIQLRYQMPGLKQGAAISAAAALGLAGYGLFATQQRRKARRAKRAKPAQTSE